MMNNLLKTATRPSAIASRVNRLGGAVAQKSLHTPIGNTSQIDDSFQVSFQELRFRSVRFRTIFHLDSVKAYKHELWP